MTASQMTLEAIRSVPLFASLDDEAAADLRNLLSDRVVPQNTRLFRQGDKGDGMYLIESGRVRISIQDDDQQELTLAELAQGDFFGEMSIIDGRQRSADAHVVEDARLAVLSRDAFLSFVRTNPDVALEMLSALTDRLRRTDELLRSRVSRNVNEEAKARSTARRSRCRPDCRVWRKLEIHQSFDGDDRVLDHPQLFHTCRRFRSQAISNVESGVGDHRRNAGADHHDVAESPGREGSIARGSRLPGKFEKRTLAGGSLTSP